MHKTKTYFIVAILMIAISFFISLSPIKSGGTNSNKPKAILIESEKFYFNSFVDCNMAEAWIGDTFRISMVTPFRKIK
jgi:hypothetical protein